MHIINKFGVMHTIPDDMPLPAGARKASASEVAKWEQEDAENKSAILRKKQATALARAQTVVVGAPAEPVEPVEPPAPKNTAKKESDAK